MSIYIGTGKVKRVYSTTTPVKKIYIGNNLVFKASRLPNAYQEVEWIGTSGTQYIKTGVSWSGSSSFKWEIKAQSTSNNTQVLFSSSNNASGGTWLGIYQNKWWFDSAFTETYSDLIEAEVNYNGSSLTCTINGNTHTKSSPAITGTNACLFCADNLSSYASVKLYKCILYKNGTKIRELVPCYRTSDNEIGLYDLVNNVFYTNEGTGVFTKGGNV